MSPGLVVPVLGVDACPTGWVGVALNGDSAPSAIWAKTIADLAIQVPDVAVIAIDIPIGLPDDGTRACDVAVRTAVGPRRNSVFLTPIRSALEAPTFEDANRQARAVTGAGISQQSYALRTKILEVERWVGTTTCRVCEVHPELSFATLAGRPLKTSKKTWAGARERLQLLDGADVPLESDFGVAGEKAGFDDVLDAAAAAWTGRRIAAGSAVCFAASNEIDASGRPAAIWA